MRQLVEFNKDKCERLQYHRDLCLGRLYVIEVDNPHYDSNKDCCDVINPEYFHIDAVYIGSIPVYGEEGYHQHDIELFAEINSKSVYEVTEPTFRVYLDEQYNIRSRNLL